MIVYLKFKVGKVLIFKVCVTYQHVKIETSIESTDHLESMKYASDAIAESFLQFREISLHDHINNSLARHQLCYEMYLRDTDNYSGAIYGESRNVLNVFDCVKHCYADSKCQAYQIDAPNSHQMRCQLFSEAIESPLKPIPLVPKRIIGIKPNRLSS